MADIMFPRLNDILSDELNHMQECLKLRDSMVESLFYSWLENKIIMLDSGGFKHFTKKEK